MKNSFFINVYLVFMSIFLGSTFMGNCTKVIDGDTIYVSIQGKKHIIRLYGIDASELKQEYGKFAKNFLSQILIGKIVTIKTVTTDYYGRTVALIYMDGISIQSVLLESGMAWVYDKYCRHSLCANWRTQQEKALQERHGLWLHKEDALPPWQWRKQSKHKK